MTKKKSSNPFALEDWTEESLVQTWDIVRKLAIEKYGLNFYKPNFEVVSFEDMLYIYTGSLPIMYDHWSFGKAYNELYKRYINDLMGVAYEVIFNTNPALCYLTEHNSPTMQGLVMAHAAVGHSAFFKNNHIFKELTNASTVIPFLKNMKAYVKECEEKHGADKVEELLDCCHALSLYAIDRRPSKEKTPKAKEALRIKRAINKDDEYDTSLEVMSKEAKTNDIGYTRQREENILKFIGRYSPALKPWQREIIQMYCKVQQYLYPQMMTKLMNEGFACVDGNTEYLSDEGFRKISEYAGGKVAQYNKDGTIEFVIPKEWYKYDNAELINIESEGVNQCVTPNHRIIYNSARWNLNEIRADELNLSINRYFITGGLLKTDSQLALTNAEIRIMMAVISDGHFNPNTTTNHCQLALVKKRKIVRIQKLLEDANISYKIQKQTQGRTCFSFYAPERNKELNMYFKASRDQLEIMLDEYKNWDGSTNNGREIYFGTNKNNMDFIQYAIAMTDGKGKLIEYQPKGNRQKIYSIERARSHITTLSGGNIEKLSGKHSVYCFSVPSTMFITRRNGVVNVTGNSFWHHQIMEDLGDMGLLNAGNSIEFIHSHCCVLRQPDYDERGYYGLNPYKLGFEIFNDIKRICQNPTEEDKEWFPGLIGKDWVEEVKFAAYNFKDESFILQYLSPKLIRDFKLFSIRDNEEESEYEISDIHDDEGYKRIRTKLSKSFNFGERLPDIYVEGWDARRSRTLYLVFQEKDEIMIEEDSAIKVISLLKKLWPFPIVFKGIFSDGSEFKENI